MADSTLQGDQMPAWMSYPVKSVGEIFRDDVWRAVGAIVLIVLGMTGLVSALDNSFTTFDQPAEFGVGALFVGCMILTTTDPREQAAERVRDRRDVWNAAVRKAIGGGLIFCVVAIATGLAAGAYFPVSTDTFAMILGGSVLGCIAYGAVVLISRRIWMKWY